MKYWPLLGALACEPSVVPATPPAVVVPTPPEAVGDDCRRDIPDCSAACALRSTGHLEFIDWYDRRCAAVILGKNPDKVAGVAPPDPPPQQQHASPDDLLANPYR